MSTTPTERRLAITPGDAILGDENNDCAEIQLENGAVISFGRHDKMSGVPVMTRDEMLAEVHLGIDAHNTANACHLTPSELLAKLREAETVVRSLLDEAYTLHSDDRKAANSFLSNLPK